jgi:signal transduction histidine kinase
MQDPPDGLSQESSLRFEVDSYLLLQLGEKLFAKKALAVAELVKNAYDADATKAVVRFENVTKPGGTITVEDDGAGMTFDEFQAGWMCIATYEKQRKPFSESYGRPRAGAKGIGRFACRVLSDSLILQSVSTVSSGRKEQIEATFDWKKFKPGQKVNAVSIPCSRTSVPFSTRTGTRLILKNVPEPWTKESMRLLRNELLSLITTFTPEIGAKQRKQKGDLGFQTIIRAPEFKEEEGLLAETFLELYAWGRLIGELDASGKSKFTLLNRLDKSTSQYTPDAKFPNLGRVNLRIDMVSYKSKHFPDDSGISLKEAQKVGRERGGVRVYFDGFRVLPYGESGDDWLNLDSDRARRLAAFREFQENVESDLERPMLLLPGNNQLFGSVLLSRVTNPNIQITLTRDRLLDNDAFSHLRSWVRLGIEWMTVKYAEWMSKSKRKEVRKESPIAQLKVAAESVRHNEEKIGSEATAEILQSLRLAEEAFEQREDERISEISMLRVLATTGTLVLTFQHELGLMVDELSDVGEDLNEIGKELPTSFQKKILDAAGRVTGWVTTIREYGTQMGSLLGIESRRRRQEYHLRPLIDVTEAPFARHFSAFGIQFDNQVNEALVLPPMYRAEVVAIFLNLLTNSAKAVKESNVRKIIIDSQEEEELVKVRVLDTGPGVPPAKREEVFEPFVTTSKPDPLFGQGTGLGLTIVRNLLDTYGGTARFVDPPDGWGACVEIVLPKEIDSE